MNQGVITPRYAAPPDRPVGRSNRRTRAIWLTDSEQGAHFSGSSVRSTSSGGL
ncbi:MAG: hypothetical protein JWL77_2339 [Chthonomonadaceae bacterium]|nr:hypothetical protein [Chthonomonadaceae bacterium]